MYVRQAAFGSGGLNRYHGIVFREASSAVSMTEATVCLGRSHTLHGLFIYLDHATKDSRHSPGDTRFIATNALTLKVHIQSNYSDTERSLLNTKRKTPSAIHFQKCLLGK